MAAVPTLAGKVGWVRARGSQPCRAWCARCAPPRAAVLDASAAATAAAAAAATGQPLGRSRTCGCRSPRRAREAGPTPPPLRVPAMGRPHGSMAREGQPPRRDRPVGRKIMTGQDRGGARWTRGIRGVGCAPAIIMMLRGAGGVCQLALAAARGRAPTARPARQGEGGRGREGEGEGWGELLRGPPPPPLPPLRQWTSGGGWSAARPAPPPSGRRARREGGRWGGRVASPPPLLKTSMDAGCTAGFPGKHIQRAAG